MIRHKVKAVIMKQWKMIKTIYKNLKKFNEITYSNYTEKELLGVVNARLGLYRMCNYPIINFLLPPKLLETRQRDSHGLFNPLKYYLSKL